MLMLIAHSQISGACQRWPSSSGGHAKGPWYDRYDLESRHLRLLHRIHHQPAACDGLDREGPPSLPNPMLCYHLVQHYGVHGGDEIWLGLRVLTILSRRR